QAAGGTSQVARVHERFAAGPDDGDLGPEIVWRGGAVEEVAAQPRRAGGRPGKSDRRVSAFEARGGVEAGESRRRALWCEVRVQRHDPLACAAPPGRDVKGGDLQPEVLRARAGSTLRAGTPRAD